MHYYQVCRLCDLFPRVLNSIADLASTLLHYYTTTTQDELAHYYSITTYQVRHLCDFFPRVHALGRLGYAVATLQAALQYLMHMPCDVVK